MSQLLSAILPDNLDDFLQVYISLPQTQSPVTDTTVTAPVTARTTHATRRRRKTKTATAATTAAMTAATTAMTSSQEAPPPPNTLPSDGIAALAQIDTGCQVGDVINRRVLRGLGGEPHLRNSDSPMWMCSGLNNQCIESTTVLDIVVSFKKDSLNYTFSLPVRIAEDSEVDLILGLQTIKNLNLVKVIPEFFQNLDQINPTDTTPSPWKKSKTSSSSDTTLVPVTVPMDITQDEYPYQVTASAGIPLYYEGPTILPTVIVPTSQPSLPLHTDVPTKEYYTGPTLPSAIYDSTGLKPSSTDNRRQDNLVSRGACTKQRCTSSCGCQTGSTAAAVGLESVESTLLPEDVAAPMLLPLGQGGLGLNTDRGPELAPPASSPRTPAQTRGYVAALIREREDSSEAQPFGPEGIDYKSKDTFAPFQETKNTDETYLVDLIHIAGTPTQIAKIRAICLRRKKLFKNELGPEPARIPPFGLDVDHILWHIFKNRVAPRQQSTRKQAEIRRQIEAMLKAGIITKSNASYYSQVILALKPDGTFRFCIDYRNLNDATKPASWPIPHIRQMLGRLGAHKADTFGVIDLTAGYHQAPLNLNTRVYTAFTTFMGVYEFTRLPFGPKRAPSYFQEVMASVVLKGLIYRTCEVYLDDIIVFGNGHEEFCERLDEIFERLEQFNISLKAAKLKLGVNTVEYVGRQISKEGISMSSKKIRGVTDFPMPRKMTELRSFLGLTNYFRDHVPNHSNVVAPLHALIDHAAKKQTLLVWTDEAADAFTKVKTLIAKSPLLYFIHDTAPITLMTDASDYGIGGYLYQEVNEKKQLVALVSKSLTKTQLRWSVIQKEAYAIFYCCTFLDALLRDRQFTILTDHKNLTYIDKESNQMVGRWRMALQELDYTIGYVPGPKNDIADAMSRLCKNNMPVKGIVTALLKIKPISTDHYKLIGDCHNEIVGHGGVQRTMRNLRKINKKWIGMRAAVKTFIANCACCQKMSAKKFPVNAYRFTASTYKPMECLNIDFVGPFPDKGYILVMIDTFTRFVELKATPDNTAKSACSALVEHIGRYGAPSILRSDNGPHFANFVVDEFTKLVGVAHNKILAYSSEENAIVERINKEVNRHITAYTFDRATTENYKEILPFVQRILNSTVNDITGVSPAQLIYGNAIDIDANILLSRDELEINPLTATTSTKDMLRMQEELIRISAQLLKEADDAHNAKQSNDITEFAVDSFVLVNHRNKPDTRMHTLWRGPLRVISNYFAEYTLLDLVTDKQIKYHMTQMKPFHFDPMKTNPTDIARRDYLEFFIEEILDMEGNISQYGTLRFKVKWLNYPQENNTWEPWKNLRKAEKLHRFLIAKNLKHLIPREFRLDYV